MTENMKIWDAVSKTDPSHTKKVNQRGGFTAIDAHYQIQLATEQFGPIGKGWGFVTGDPLFQDGAVIIPVCIWHGERDNTYGPLYGCAEMTGKRLVTDAPKKATTDGITKGLSMLGFNADVFLGKFDDSKYVAQVDAEYREKEAQAISSGVGDAWGDGIFDSLPEDPSEAAVAEAYANQLREDALGYKTAKGVNNFLVKRREALNFVEMHLPDVFPALRNDIAEHRDKLEK